MGEKWILFLLVELYRIELLSASSTVGNCVDHELGLYKQAFLRALLRSLIEHSAMEDVPLWYGLTASRAMFRWARLLSRPSLNSEPWSTVIERGLPVERMWFRMCLFAVCAVRSLDGKALILEVAPSTMMRTLLKPQVEFGK